MSLFSLPSRGNLKFFLKLQSSFLSWPKPPNLPVFWTVLFLAATLWDLGFCCCLWFLFPAHSRKPGFYLKTYLGGIKVSSAIKLHVHNTVTRINWMMRTCLVENIISEIFQLPETQVTGNSSEFLLRIWNFKTSLLFLKEWPWHEPHLWVKTIFWPHPLSSFSFLVKVLQRTGHRNSTMNKS